MKKFNEKKWRLINKNKEDCYLKLNSINEDLHFNRRNFTKNFEEFNRLHTSGRNDDPITGVIEKDKKNTSLIIERRLDELKGRKQSACDLFAIENDSNLFLPLIKIYSELLEYILLLESHFQAQEIAINYGASFNVLSDFAKKHTNVKNLINSPVIDAQTAYYGQ